MFRKFYQWLVEHDQYIHEAIALLLLIAFVSTVVATWMHAN